MRMWAKLANDYLNTVPHKHHGVYTKGTAEYTEAAGLPQQIKSAMHRINPDLGISINNMFTAEGIENEQTNMMDKLGLDSKNPRLRQTINDYFENQLMNRLGQFGEINAPIMTVRQLFEQMYPDVDIESLLKHGNRRVVQQNKICPNRTIFDRLAAFQSCPKSTFFVKIIKIIKICRFWASLELSCQLVKHCLIWKNFVLLNSHVQGRPS